MLKITITGDRAEGKTMLAKLIARALINMNVAFEKERGKEDVICISDSEQMRRVIMLRGEK